MQRDYGFACLFVSHDLAAVEEIADRVVVMHKGQIVEKEGSRDAVFDRPSHHYTQALLAAAPRVDSAAFGGGRALRPMPVMQALFGARKVDSGQPRAPIGNCSDCAILQA